MTTPFSVAIDGPAGAGKSVLGDALARAIGATYIDSGIVYRAITWLAIERGAELDSDVDLTPLTAAMQLEIVPPTADDGRQFTIRLDNTDITWAVRTAQVDASVSRPSALPGVRSAVTDHLRRLAAGRRVVMVGRDIGTVVLPDATLKLYVSASSETRAYRRTVELRNRGVTTDENAVHDSLLARDLLDRTRATAPLRAADDAFLIETDTLTLDEEVAIALQELRRRLGSPNVIRPRSHALHGGER